jgi:hypothetical protein
MFLAGGWLWPDRHSGAFPFLPPLSPPRGLGCDSRRLARRQRGDHAVRATEDPGLAQHGLRRPPSVPADHKQGGR